MHEVEQRRDEPRRRDGRRPSTIDDGGRAAAVLRAEWATLAAAVRELRSRGAAGLGQQLAGAPRAARKRRAAARALTACR